MVMQYINGRLVKGDGKDLTVINPATDEVIQAFPGATAQQAVQALEAARTAFQTWSHTSVDERVNWLRKYIDAIMVEKETIVDILSAETGKPYAEAVYDFD